MKIISQVRIWSDEIRTLVFSNSWKVNGVPKGIRTSLLSDGQFFHLTSRIVNGMFSSNLVSMRCSQKQTKAKRSNLRHTTGPKTVRLFNTRAAQTKPHTASRISIIAHSLQITTRTYGQEIH